MLSENQIKNLLDSYSMNEYSKILYIHSITNFSIEDVVTMFYETSGKIEIDTIMKFLDDKYSLKDNNPMDFIINILHIDHNILNILHMNTKEYYLDKTTFECCELLFTELLSKCK